MLIEALRDEKLWSLAVSTLGTIGPNAAPAVPALLDRYERARGDHQYPLQHTIILALGRIGPGAKDALPLMIELSKKDDLVAARAVWRIDPQYCQLAIDVSLGQLGFAGRRRGNEPDEHARPGARRINAIEQRFWREAKGRQSVSLAKLALKRRPPLRFSCQSSKRGLLTTSP